MLANAGPALITAVRCVADPTVREPMAFLAGVAKWDAWGWAELLACADRLIAATPELVQAYRRIRLVPMLELSRWVASEVAAYKTGPSHWPNWRGSIYR